MERRTKQETESLRLRLRESVAISEESFGEVLEERQSFAAKRSG